MTNHQPVERIYPDDTRVKPQTVAHHVARYKLAALTFKKKGQAALDMACGTGYGSEILRQAGFEVTGVDRSWMAISFAAKRYPQNTFVASAASLFDYKKYDLVVMFEALEHFDDEEALLVLRYISQSLKKGGQFIMSVPVDTNPKYNKFHLSKWDYKKLQENLRKNFNRVNIIGQDWDTSDFSETNIENNDFYIAFCNND